MKGGGNMNDKTKTSLEVAANFLDEVINNEDNEYVAELIREVQTEMFNILEQYGKK